MMLERQTFVLQRRVLAPHLDALRVATDRRFGAGGLIAADTEGALRIDEPFRLTDVVPHWRWRATGTLLDQRGRRVARVELEIGPWSADDVELTLRPCARHPERWNGRRCRAYFRHAHRCIDELRVLLRDRRRRAPLGRGPRVHA
jgi:hypothetical protein